MRVLSLLIFIAVTHTCSAQEKIKVKDDKMKVKGQASVIPNTGQPYIAEYSSKFTVGDEKYANIILDLWKDYDNNTLMAHDYFADTATVYFSDGSSIKGKQQLAEAVGKYRASLASVNSILEAWVPLHSIDRNQDVVAIWGTENYHHADGTVTKTEIHEVWGFNQDGKVAWMRQWMAKPTAQ